MGAYDVPLLIGAAAVVGYFILQNPDLLSGIFPKPADGNTSTVDPNGEFVDAGTDTSKDSSNCSSLCKSGDCDGYDDEGCSKGCSKCKSGGGGGGGSSGGSSKSSSGGGSGGSNCNDGHSCNTRCTNSWCNSLRDCCKGFNCDKCSGGGGSSSSGGGGKSSCSSKCKKGLKVARESPCTCTKCGKISCGGGGGSSGSSGGSSKSKCVVSKCPQCGAYPNYRICKNNNTSCGCAKVGSNLAKVVSYRASHIAQIKETAFRISLS